MLLGLLSCASCISTTRILDSGEADVVSNLLCRNGLRRTTDDRQLEVDIARALTATVRKLAEKARAKIVLNGEAVARVELIALVLDQIRRELQWAGNILASAVDTIRDV